MSTSANDWRPLLQFSVRAGLLLAALGVLCVLGLTALAERHQAAIARQKLRHAMHVAATVLNIGAPADVARSLLDSFADYRFQPASAAHRAPAGSLTHEALRTGWVERSETSPSGEKFWSVAVRVGDGVMLGRAPLWSAAPVYVPLFTATAIGTALVGAGLAWREWRRWIQPARNLAAAVQPPFGQPPARQPIDRSPPAMQSLARSLETLRLRLLTDAGAISRERRVVGALLDQLNEGVIVTDSRGRIALMNPAALRLLNILATPASAWIGRAVELCVPQHDLQHLLRPGAGTTPNEVRLQVDSPGAVSQILARASSIILPRDDPQAPADSGRLMVLTDITELSRTLQLRTDFVANASHELRTPLSTIRAAIETLAQIDAAAEPEASSRLIGVLQRQAGRLEALVNDLLDLARLESAGGNFEPVVLNWRDLTRELRDRFHDSLQAKGLTLVQSSGDVTTVVVAPYLLQLVLDNLVDNAIKFSQPGGEIRLRCQPGPDGVVIEVADDGCGIPDADQPRVFERFYQVERGRAGGTARGTGLGLSIVRHAVAAMRGTVGLRSALGKGTTFTVTIPQGADANASGRPRALTER